MKPVIKKQIYHDVILMRDDKKVTRLRIRSSLLTFLIALFCLLILAGAAGIYAGYHYWTKSSSLKEQLTASEDEAAQIRVQLEELSNVKSLFKATNTPLPQSKDEQLTAPHDSFLPASGNGSKNMLPAGERSTSMPSYSANASLPLQNNDSLQNRQTVNATTNATNSELETSKALPIDSEKSPLRINNFISRVTGQSSVYIHYDLIVTAQDTTIKGKVKYSAMLKNGTRYELPPHNTDSKRFAISRRKNMETSARFPESINIKDITGVDVSVELEDGTLLQSAFPVSSR